MTAAIRPAPNVPGKALAVLVVAVLVVHLLVLQAAPGAIRLDDPMAGRTFITRTIQINKPPDPAKGMAAAPVPPAPVQATAPPVVVALAATAPAPVPRASEPVRLAAAQASVQPAVTAPASSPPTPAVAPVATPAPAPAPAPPAPTVSEASAPPTPSPGRSPEGPRATAFSLPGSVRLKYNVTSEVRKQSWTAFGELLWRHDGAQYDARLGYEVPFLGSRTRTSTGRITSEGLAPTRFSDKSKAEVAAHFERERGKIVFSANTAEATLQAGAQDQLSVFLQLGAMIAGEPQKYPAGTAITMQTAGPREAEDWTFKVENEEKLQLVNGEIPALKLTRNPRRDFDLRVELWLAPSLGYLPARIRLTQANGDYVDQQLRSADRP
ncbi:MAG: DUF3108 domain-containing protein [Bdellovibrionales bacterium]|nr:DUF3108 domain-containing protein [Ramlibacter sp.]